MSDVTITYGLEAQLDARTFQVVLEASGLGERRPVHDLARLNTMLRRADIVAVARHNGKAVGVARALCDFSYCCYLSDLAVVADMQRQGIGRALIDLVAATAGPQCALILLAAPAAEDYYPHIGMVQRPSCWARPRQS